MILLDGVDVWSGLVESFCDIAWFRGLRSCLVQRIKILLCSEDYDLAWFRGLWSCLVQRITMLLGLEDNDLAFVKRVYDFHNTEDLWSCFGQSGCVLWLGWEHLRSCLVQRIMILLKWEDLLSGLVQSIMILFVRGLWFCLVQRIYYIAWFRGLMILLGWEDLWSCFVQRINDPAWLRGFMILLCSED